MEVNIFILCFNESILLPKTVNFYKSRFPNCTITIYDNMSTDNSVEIAKELGCKVCTFDSGGKNDVRIKRDVANTCWKNITKGWIIMADMDEWLDITEKDLDNETKKGTTIIKTKGYDMIGESRSAILDDIDLNNITKCVPNTFEDKNICFFREKINSMNYSVGSHNCSPKGSIKYSMKVYTIKHMAYVGLAFIINKMKQRYERSGDMQKIGFSVHYTNDINKISNKYVSLLLKSKDIK